MEGGRAGLIIPRRPPDFVRCEGQRALALEVTAKPVCEAHSIFIYENKLVEINLLRTLGRGRVRLHPKTFTARGGSVSMSRHRRVLSCALSARDDGDGNTTCQRGQRCQASNAI
ncbi:unnamed protein product [Boreogadus saida]